MACPADGCGRASRSRGRASAGPAHGEGACEGDSPGRAHWLQATRTLATSARSRGDLDQRLARAGHGGTAREDALESLDRAGLVDDVRLAETRAAVARASRLRRRCDPSRPPTSPDRSRDRRRRGRRARARARPCREGARRPGRHPETPPTSRRARLLARHARRDRLLVCAGEVNAIAIGTHYIRRFACKSSFSETRSDD